MLALLSEILPTVETCTTRPGIELLEESQTLKKAAVLEAFMPRALNSTYILSLSVESAYVKFGEVPERVTRLTVVLPVSGPLSRMTVPSVKVTGDATAPSPSASVKTSHPVSKLMPPPTERIAMG